MEDALLSLILIIMTDELGFHSVCIIAYLEVFEILL